MLKSVLDGLTPTIEPVVGWFNERKRLRKYLTYICITFGIYTMRNVFWFGYYKYYKFPPYITLGVPFFGNGILFARDPEKFCLSTVCGAGDKKGNKYSLTSVPLGYQTIIFVNNFEIAKKLLKTQEIGCNRPIFRNQFELIPDFAFINGDDWLKRRKLIQSAFGSIAKSSVIHKNILNLFNNHLYNALNEISTKSVGWYSSKYTNLIAMYTIMTSIFGDNPDTLHKFNKFYHLFSDSLAVSVPSVSFYLLYSTLINFKIPDKIMWTLFSARYHSEKQIKLLKDYLMQNQMSITRNIFYNINSQYSEEELLSDCYGLLAAGMETTAKQIEFGLIILCQYPCTELQDILYNELHTVNDGVYDPALLLSKYHYLRAFVHEIIRFGIISPFGLPHMCLNNDVVIDDYVIYKGSTVMINHLAMHHQQDNGHIFDINRWLDAGNKFNTQYKINNFMVFGYSTRDCVGQNIALQELYSVFALILSKYIVYNKDIEGTYDIKRTWKVTRDIQPEIPIYLKQRH